MASYAETGVKIRDFRTKEKKRETDDVMVTYSKNSKEEAQENKQKNKILQSCSSRMKEQLFRN